MIQVVDVYDVKKFIQVFPFAKVYPKDKLEHNIPDEYRPQMNRDWHRYFNYYDACRASLNSYTPERVWFKIVMTIK